MRNELISAGVINRALIIAAGRGLRLNAHSQDIPKSLIAAGERSIIETILATLQRAGIDEVVIVTGYKNEIIEQRLGDGGRLGLRLLYVFNPNWQKKNGVSVFAARHCFHPDEHFLLMMSDHLFAPGILATLLSTRLEAGEIALAVDTKIDAIFDIDDATKVFCEGSRIKEIGKTLAVYNGIDCGLFKCTTALFDALAAAMVDGDCSLTDGCRQLIASGKMQAVDIGQAFWIDIDTPQALAYATDKLRLLDDEAGHGKR
ncbi:NTP transferase domain-containing protein [candidate division KSB1 bacterium]|nr:NTP transferase domain-containing protein [candidate division KSB1 bacterium]